MAGNSHAQFFMQTDSLPLTGFGLGLRAAHYDVVLATRPALDWFEIITENFLDAHEGYWDFLADLRQTYNFVLHGVSLSIGGIDPFPPEYFIKLKRLIAHVRPAVVSDHLCFTGLGGHNTHDLLPLPYTEAALTHVTARVQEVQNVLGRQLVLENPSSYLEFAASTMPEAEFLARLAEQSGCGLLLDVNNIYVSGFNHGFSPAAYIATLPPAAIRYVHLAGHRHCGTHIIDTHDAPVIEPVWQLYEQTLALIGARPTMLEWDDQLPEFSVLLAELANARSRCGG
jgi:uncharacterized protein